MSEEIAREDKMKDAFLVLGSQYFAHASYSAQALYLPVSVTLFHHSIEMLMKGYLSKTHTSTEMKKIGHNLLDLWTLFKEQTSSSQLSDFDETIRQLDRVELLRYPDEIVDKGYALHLSLGAPSIPLYFPESEGVPQYLIGVSDIEAIAIEIYKACEVSPKPYFKLAPDEFKRVLPPEMR